MKQKLLTGFLLVEAATMLHAAPVKAAETKSCEPNNTRAEAVALTTDGNYDEIGSVEGDEDWYSFPCEAGQTYYIFMGASDGVEVLGDVLMMDVYENDEKDYSDAFKFSLKQYEGWSAPIASLQYKAHSDGTCYLRLYADADTDNTQPVYKTIAHTYGITVLGCMPGTTIAKYNGYTFMKNSDGDIYCYDSEMNKVKDCFMCDGTYTYFFQHDGTAMKDRLTYHPDGVHVIYFDEDGHEVFSDFHHVSQSISGDAVDDQCFFDVYGYMYVDVLTYDKTGTYLLYANPYGRLECAGWFQFSDTVKWADGTACTGIAGGYGYGQSNCHLMTNTSTQDWLGRTCYLQGNGVASY